MEDRGGDNGEGEEEAQQELKASSIVLKAL